MLPLNDLLFVPDGALLAQVPIPHTRISFFALPHPPAWKRERGLTSRGVHGLRCATRTQYTQHKLTIYFFVVGHSNATVTSLWVFFFDPSEKKKEFCTLDMASWFNWIAGRRVAPVPVPTDTVVPVYWLDDTKTYRAIVMYCTLVYDDVLDADKLAGALEKLLEKPGWRKLGARLRLNVCVVLFQIFLPQRFCIFDKDVRIQTDDKR